MMLGMKIKDRIDEMRKLNDGWNGEGSVSPIPSALDAVACYWRTLDISLVDRVWVCPMRNGYVAFECLLKTGRVISLLFGAEDIELYSGLDFCGQYAKS